MLKDTNTYLYEKQQLIFYTTTDIAINVNFYNKSKVRIDPITSIHTLLISHIKEVIDYYSTVTDFAKFRG